VPWNIEINSSDGSESDYSLRSAQSLELNKFNSNDNLPQVLACVASFKFELGWPILIGKFSELFSAGFTRKIEQLLQK